MALPEFGEAQASTVGLLPLAGRQETSEAGEAARRARAAADIAGAGLVAQAIFDENGVVRDDVVLLEDYFQFYTGESIPAREYTGELCKNGTANAEGRLVRYYEEDAIMMRAVVQNLRDGGPKQPLKDIGAQAVSDGSVKLVYMRGRRYHEKLRHDPIWGGLWKEEGTNRRVYGLEGLPDRLPDQTPRQLPHAPLKPRHKTGPRRPSGAAASGSASPGPSAASAARQRLTSVAYEESPRPAAVLGAIPRPNERVFKRPPIRHPKDERARSFSGLSVDFVYRTDGRAALRSEAEVLPFTNDDLTVMAVVREYPKGAFFGEVYRRYCQETRTQIDPRDFWNKLDRIQLVYADRGIADWRDGFAVDSRDGRRKRKLGLFSDSEAAARSEAS